MNADEIPAPSVLPCGCRLIPKVVNGVRTLEMHACRAGCTYVAAALKMADEQCKPAEVRETRA